MAGDGPDDSRSRKRQTWPLSHIRAATRRQNCPKIGLNVRRRAWRAQGSGKERAFAEPLLRVCPGLLTLGILRNPHDDPVRCVQVPGPGRDLSAPPTPSAHPAPPLWPPCWSSDVSSSSPPRGLCTPFTFSSQTATSLTSHFLQGNVSLPPCFFSLTHCI